MPKILYISHSFVTNVNRKIASGLKDLGYEVTLVTPLAIETGKFLKFAEKIDNSNDIIFLKIFMNYYNFFCSFKNIFERFYSVPQTKAI